MNFDLCGADLNAAASRQFAELNINKEIPNEEKEDWKTLQDQAENSPDVC